MNQGYIAIISVLIVSGITALIVGFTVLFGMGEANMGLSNQQSEYSFYLAHACAEHALLNLKDDLGYNGDEVISDFENGSCEVRTVEGGGNQDRLIETIGRAFDKTRRLKIEVSEVNPQINISSWQEVTSF
jgi:hypothetical protein